MSEIVMTTEAEVEDFTDELSDEALRRGLCALCPVQPGSFMSVTGYCAVRLHAVGGLSRQQRAVPPDLSWCAEVHQ